MIFNDTTCWGQMLLTQTIVTVMHIGERLDQRSLKL